MTTHSDETPHTCLTCGKSFKTKDLLSKHLKVHTVHTVCYKSFSRSDNLAAHMETYSKTSLLRLNKVMSESVGKEAKDLKEVSPRFKSHQSIAVDEIVQDVDLPKCRSVLNERKYPVLHSSEVPFIINVKQEEDM